MTAVSVVTMDSHDLDEVLAQLTRQRQWMVHYVGGSQTPHLIAFTFRWRESGCADVLLLRGEHDAAAYRTPDDDGHADILRPDLVCWSYEASAEATAIWAMRAVLTIPPPTHPDAPCTLYSAPASCRVPGTEERPLVIRPTWISA